MAQKKAFRLYNSFRAVFGFRNIRRAFFRTSDSVTSRRLFLNTRGFTLLELTVDVAVIVILSIFILALINPAKQFERARDAQRQHDLMQIRNSLDNYYNDRNCYPTSVPFGAAFVQGATVYMSKVPQDVMCTVSGACYEYATDPQSSCPQWNVLFAKLALAPSDARGACPLPPSCFPANYQQSGYNFCMPSGDVNCPILNRFVLPVPVVPTATPTPPPSGSGGSSPTPTETSTPTPTESSTVTPTPTASSTPSPTETNCSKNYSCRAGLCNIVPVGTGDYCDPHCLGACP